VSFEAARGRLCGCVVLVTVAAMAGCGSPGSPRSPSGPNSPSANTPSGTSQTGTPSSSAAKGTASPSPSTSSGPLPAGITALAPTNPWAPGTTQYLEGLDPSQAQIVAAAWRGSSQAWAAAGCSGDGTTEQGGQLQVIYIGTPGGLNTVVYFQFIPPAGSDAGGFWWGWWPLLPANSATAWCNTATVQPPPSWTAIPTAAT